MFQLSIRKPINQKRSLLQHKISPEKIPDTVNQPANVILT